ncbi:MAG: DUF2764 family protein [Bacteroidales bacterium]
MLERNYYYLVAGLPDIMLDQKKLTFSLEEFREEMKYHLHPNDYGFVELLFLPVDNRNLLNILLKNNEPFDESGKYSQEEIEQDIKDPSGTLAYMQKIISAFKSETPVFEGLSWEDQLTWLYYEHVKNCSNEFLRDWFEFDLNLKNIVAGMNARNHKLKADKYFIGDNFVVQAVRKSSLKDFGLSNDFEYMERLITIQENENLLEREKAMDNMRWEYLDDRNTFNYFTVEVLLAYVIKLQMVQRWLELDIETGKEMFRKLLEDLEQSYEFPEEFAIKDTHANR